MQFKVAMEASEFELLRDTIQISDRKVQMYTTELIKFLREYHHLSDDLLLQELNYLVVANVLNINQTSTRDQNQVINRVRTASDFVTNSRSSSNLVENEKYDRLEDVKRFYRDSNYREAGIDYQRDVGGDYYNQAYVQNQYEGLDHNPTVPGPFGENNNTAQCLEKDRFHVQNPVRSEELLAEIGQLFDIKFDDTRRFDPNSFTDRNFNPKPYPFDATSYSDRNVNPNSCPEVRNSYPKSNSNDNLRSYHVGAASYSDRNVNPNSYLEERNINPKSSSNDRSVDVASYSDRNISPNSYPEERNSIPKSNSIDRNINSKSYTAGRSVDAASYSDRNVNPNSYPEERNINPKSSSNDRSVDVASYSDRNISPNSYPEEQNIIPKSNNNERNLDANGDTAKTLAKDDAVDLAESQRNFSDSETKVVYVETITHDELGSSENEENDIIEAKLQSDWRKYWLSKLKSQKGT
jgi:hypothetical protein